MQEILLKIRYFEKGLSKSLKLYFFFRTQSLLKDKIKKIKRDLEPSSQSLIKLQNKFSKIRLLVWKGMEKLQRFVYLKNEKSFSDEIESFSHSF